jgi:hypothetical protein
MNGIEHIAIPRDLLLRTVLWFYFVENELFDAAMFGNNPFNTV